MIVFAAFMPHTPLLLESIGKENRRKFKKTLLAIERLVLNLLRAAPDTLVVISAHATIHADAFSINVHEPYRVDLSKFGDLGATQTFQPDMQLIDHIQRLLRRNGMPLTLDTDHALDHGATVPLLLLTKHLPTCKVVPITYSGLGPKEHAAFGRALKEALAASKKRVAIIATGDLSHALSKKSPLGMRPEGKRFDQALCHAVDTFGLSQLLSLEPGLIEMAGECAYRPCIILFGILEKMPIKPERLAYEAPFGVGYLTAEFHLK